ncbi:polyprotein [Plakobranchus ocellatus]|uniref:Polyprotein n=1 Tax=Plakobranchus ocellatus TaxID=259542 RepID=A0AAV4A910_9GAST|nr:polyprotein [Plakobranchus ocellatus]
MAPLRISFLIRSVYDLLPSNANLVRWKRRTTLHAHYAKIILVELTVPYESRMEEAHAFKEAKYLDLTKQLKKDGDEAKVMPVEIGTRGFVGSSAYGLLSKLSICGNKRAKALRLLAETAASKFSLDMEQKKRKVAT